MVDTAGTTVRLLGPARIEVGGRPVRLHSRRSVAVLVTVLLRAGPHDRATLAASLWPAAPRATALGNLRVVLSDLRSHVGDALVVDRTSLCWAGAPDVAVDLHALETAIACVSDTSVAAEQRTAAGRHVVSVAGLELATGVEHLGDDELARGLEIERVVLRGRVEQAMAAFVELLLEQGLTVEAVDVATRLAGPYPQASHPVLARALAARATAAATATATAGIPPAQALDRPSGRRQQVLGRLVPLPTPRVLIGRDELVEQVAALRRGTGHPVVTLTGPGGVGKTSVAVAVAHEWRRQGHDVVFADLTTADDGRLVASVVGDAIGLTARDEAGAVAALVRSLGERDIRLVVDNLEHVLDASGTLATIVRACPNLTVLVTSRVPTRLASETVVTVPPLAGQDAVRLFRERALAAGASVDHTGDDLAHVLRACALLDGLPLAIELAAARRGVMGASAIAGAIEQGLADGDLEGLADEDAGLPVRHRGLAATIRWSVDLLDDLARDLVHAVPVFPGPFTLDHVHAVCAPGRSRTDVARALRTAVDLHLLVREDATGEVWFRLLPPVRAVTGGRHRGASDVDLDELRRRRVAHDVALVRTAAAAFATPEDRRWFAHLSRYLPSLDDTIDLLHHDVDEQEATVVAALGPLWFDRGWFSGGLRLTERCRPSPQALARQPWLDAELRLWEAGLRAEADGYAAVTDLAATMLDGLCRVRDSSPPADVEVRVLWLVQHVVDLAGRADLAVELAVEAESLASRTGQLCFAVEFVYAQAMLAHVAGDDERAVTLLHRVFRDANLHGNRRIWLHARMLAELIGVEGPAGGSASELAELLDLAVALGDRRLVIWLTVSLGTVSIYDGDLAAAAALFRDAVTLSRDADYFLGLGFSLMGGTVIASLRGDRREAAAFDGAVGVHLESLSRGMPRAYLDTYHQVMRELSQARRHDPALADEHDWGAHRPLSAVVDRLSGYLLSLTDEPELPPLGQG